MLVTPFGIVMLGRLLQYANALEPILLTLLPIVTLERLVQPEKIELPIFELIIAVFMFLQR